MNQYQNYRDSKVKWIKWIPDEWNVIRGKYLFNNRVDRNHPDQPLLSVTQNDSLVRREDLETRVWNPESDVSGYKLVKDGDFVISLRSFQGGIELSEIEGVVSPVYTVMIPSPQVGSRYFKYLLKSGEFISVVNTVTTGIRQGKNISYQDFSSIYLPVPPHSTQNRIGLLLDEKTSQIDDLIEKKKRKIELLKEYRSSLISHVVTKGLDPNVEMKDSGVEWIGEVPKHWGRVKTGKVFSFHKGKNGQKLTKEYVGENPGEYPVYSGTTTGDGELGKTNEYEFDFPSGVIFVSTVGSDTSVMFTRILQGKFNLSQNCLLMVPEVEVNVEFLYLFTLVDYPQQRCQLPIILKKGHRSVGMGQLREQHLIIPPVEEQDQMVLYINERLIEIDSILLKEQQSIELLQEYRQSLISEVVTGKIKVTD